MLALTGGTCDGKRLLVMVLEPGNFEKLKRGEPIHKYLNEFFPDLPAIELVFAYTPDMQWVMDKIGGKKDMETVARAIHDSLSRPEIVVRGRSAEEMKKVF